MLSFKTFGAGSRDSVGVTLRTAIILSRLPSRPSLSPCTASEIEAVVVVHSIVIE